MYREHEIGVVVPAYNEEGFVGDVIRESPAFVDRIYVVDDRSTDGTWEEILAAAAADANGRRDGLLMMAGEQPAAIDGGTVQSRCRIHDRIGRVIPVKHRENRGAGGAIKTGYLLARADAVDITVTVDGDGQMDLTQMTRLLDPIVEGRVEYAKGNRLRRLDVRRNRGGSDGWMPAWRLFGNALLTGLTRVASGYWGLMDPQNGYTAISREALEAIPIVDIYEYYGYCNDVLVKLNAQNVRVGDVAMEPIYGEEESSIAYTEYVPKVSAMLARNFLWRLRATRHTGEGYPAAIACVAGTLAVAIAAVVGVVSTVAQVVPGDHGNRSLASPVSNVLVAVLGVGLILGGLGLDWTHNSGLVVGIDE